MKDNKIKKSINKFVSDLDKKVNAREGNKLYKIFKLVTLLLIFIGLPIIAIVFGSVALNAIAAGTAMNMVAVNATIWPYFILVVIFGSLWFFYSKWADKE